MSAEPGSWPGDPATPETPVAACASEVRLLAAEVGLDELQARISVCRACPRLVAWRQQVAAEKRPAFAEQAYWGRPVPSFGDPAASAVIVGLAPAAHGANRTGRMFTGDRSGDFLFAALQRAGYASQAVSVRAGDGLTLTGIRIVTPCHCAPPANKPTAEELATCAVWFDRELCLVKPRAILALGQIAWDAVVGSGRRFGWTVPSPKPKFGHGAVTELRGCDGTPIRLVGSYHVSQQNTFTAKLTPAMFDEALALLT